VKVALLKRKKIPIKWLKLTRLLLTLSFKTSPQTPEGGLKAFDKIKFEDLINKKNETLFLPLGEVRRG
jgi:hypothetical protein